jgi:hypothetical protein
MLDCRNAAEVQVITLLALLVPKSTQCTRFISTNVHKIRILDCRNASEVQVLTLLALLVQKYKY